MTLRDRARWALAGLLSVTILVAPAIWNRFPLLQYDTGGYLARWYEGTLVPSRAVVYGLLLNLGVPLSFWPVLIVQAALTVWIVALMLRVHGFHGRPWLMLGVIAALSVFTTLPWLTAILLTDIFCGLGVLALYLLLMRGDDLSRGERYGLIGLGALSAATHSATIAVMVALIAVAALWCAIDRKRLPTAALGRGVIALLLGAVMVLAANYAVARRLAWTPGGFALSFGRMLQDGIVNKYLDEHCPDASLQLCAYKDVLPHDADVWFWGSPLFDRLGRFAGLGKEMEHIAVRSLIEYPALQMKTAAAATAQQLVNVHTGEGVVHWIWHTYFIVHDFTPQWETAMKAARQQQAEISFIDINRLHYPLALLSMALLPVIVVLAFRKRLPGELGELAAFCALALLANAFVCGALSNPHDRYGARVVWLAAFVTGLALLRLYEQRRTAYAVAEAQARDILPA
ncbi:MAG: hypothetical protein Q8M24_24305 [Pseudolabrys sp.]|nr:hypothetical protein [Pseudolabrys sp.]MDP2298570.1 hypothetical protein [Pseudolabrys sp.]